MSGVCRGVTHRSAQQTLLSEFGTRKFSPDPTFVEHYDAITHAHKFGQFARDEYHRFTFGGESINEFVDLQLGAHIDAPGGFIKHHHGGLGHECFAQDHLLLISAGETAHASVLARGFDSQRIEELLISTMFGGLIDLMDSTDELTQA